jgi:hypothetical protein
VLVDEDPDRFAQVTRGAERVVVDDDALKQAFAIVIQEAMVAPLRAAYTQITGKID